MTFVLILLNGWHLFGFSVPISLLYLMGGSTVGEIAAMFFMVVKYR